MVRATRIVRSQPSAFWKVVAEAHTSPKALQVMNKCHPKRVARERCVGHLPFKMYLLLCLELYLNDLKRKENGSLKMQHVLLKSRSSGSCYVFESSVDRYSWIATTRVPGLRPSPPLREGCIYVADGLRETCSSLPHE